MKKFSKRILTMCIAIVFCLSISVSVYAAEAPQSSNSENTVLYDVMLLDKNGKYTTYTVNPDEENFIPVFQSKENSSGLSARAVVQTATLSIGRSSNGTVFWKFTPTFSTLFLTLGFSGSFSVTNFSGLSQGIYRYTMRMADYVPGSSGCITTLSGKYCVLGYNATDIFRCVRIA